MLPASALAIADPAAAPYSAAAVEVMKTLGVCDAPTGKIVAQTFQFVCSGNAEFGFVALSQVIARPSGSQWIVPASRNGYPSRRPPPSRAVRAVESHRFSKKVKAFLGVPLATFTALEGIQVGQSAKPQSSSNEFHWLSAARAARWTRRLGRGPASAFVTHDTMSQQLSGSKTRQLMWGASITVTWLEA